VCAGYVHVRPQMHAPVLLRRISALAVGVPALLALVGFALPYLLPNCNPQMYGVGACYFAGVNLASFVLVLSLMGLYLAY
jgi:hypothetical protein